MTAGRGARVAILGLSYKPNTPVIEESQGLALAAALARAGYRVRVSDPQAMASLPETLPAGVERADTADAAVADADVVAIITPWTVYRSLRFAAGSHARAVVDPWRMIDPASVAPEVTLIRLGMGDWREGIDEEPGLLRARS
jgi:UDPglucose 6-dehydrogenase